MLTRDYTQTGSRIALLIGQLIIILFCIGYIDYVYYVNIYPDKKVKENFQQNSCFLVNKRLASKGHLLHQYRSEFLVNYSVNGVQYSRWVSGNGLDYSYTSNSTLEQNTLDQ